MTIYDEAMLERMQRDCRALEIEFDGVVPAEAVRECAQEFKARYEGARVVDFVPLLVYRATRERVVALGTRNS